MSLWTATDEAAGKPKFDNGSDVFGVDTTEISVGGDNVTSIAVGDAGTGYASAPDVDVGGNTTSVATVSGGKVTALSVAGTNTGHTSVPAVSIAAPAAKTFNGASAVGSNAITFTAHGFATGDALTYADGGGTVVGGLTTATTYYAVNLTTNTLSLATTLENANASTPVVITLTDGAASRIKEIMSKDESKSLGVRVGVKSGGCAGMSYIMEYAKEINPNDEVIEDKGVKVFIDTGAIMYLSLIHI